MLSVRRAMVLKLELLHYPNSAFLLLSQYSFIIKVVPTFFCT